MPIIKKNDEQQKALNTITESLEYLETLCQLTRGKTYDATITFAMGKRGPRSKGNKFVIKADDKDMKKLLRILMDAGKRESKNIETLAKQFDIELSAEELNLVALCSGQKGVDAFDKDDEYPDTTTETEQDTAGAANQGEDTPQEPQEGVQKPDDSNMDSSHEETPEASQNGAEEAMKPDGSGVTTVGTADDDDDEDNKTNEELQAAMRQFM